MPRLPEIRFPLDFKRLVDRICEAQDLRREELAAQLGTSRHKLIVAAYRGVIDFDLVERVAVRARAKPEEIDAIELAWLRIQAMRPREEPLRL